MCMVEGLLMELGIVINIKSNVCDVLQYKISYKLKLIL